MSGFIKVGLATRKCGSTFIEMTFHPHCVKLILIAIYILALRAEDSRIEKKKKSFQSDFWLRRNLMLKFHETNDSDINFFFHCFLPSSVEYGD